MPAVLYIAADGDDPASIDKMMTRVGAVRLIVYPRGVGEIAWDRSFYRDTMRNAMHVGQTVDSMRLADVFVALEVLRQQPGVDAQRIMTLGRGASGILGLYAAILDPRIHQVMLVEPPSTHAESPTFLNILRHTDLPEAAALLAPRHLTFFARVPDAFGYTRHVYSLFGKPGNFFRSINIGAVVDGRYDHNTAPGL
jgi:dienelactone hydrolase